MLVMIEAMKNKKTTFNYQVFLHKMNLQKELKPAHD